MNTSMQHTRTDHVSTLTQVGRTSTGTDRPCPPWCTLPAGHGWESITTKRGADYVQRVHVLEVADIAVSGDDRLSVAIVADETVEAALGGREDVEAPAVLTTPTVSVHWPETPLLGCSAPQARALSGKLSTALDRAADELERIRS